MCALLAQLFAHVISGFGNLMVNLMIALTTTKMILSCRSEKRKRLMNSDGDMTEDYPKENDSSR